MRVSWVFATIGGGSPYAGFLCTPGAGKAPAAAASNRPNHFSKTCASCCRPFSHDSSTLPSSSHLHSVRFGHSHLGTTRKGSRASKTPSSPAHCVLSLSSRADNWEEVEEEEEKGEEDEAGERVGGHHQHSAALLKQHQRDRSSPDDNADANSSATTIRRVDQRKCNTGESGATAAVAPTAAARDDAERRFAAARSLHLRRHRSRQARKTALQLFRESMLLRPDWRETDSKFAVESGIDKVFAAFAFSREKRGLREEDYSYDDGVDRAKGSKGSWEKAGQGNRPDAGCDTGSDSIGGAISDAVSDDVNDMANGDVNGAVGDAIGDAVGCLRRTLAGVGYTAFRVQERFGPAIGAMGAQRLPGPYYLRKSLDHTHAATVASLGRPRDSLDVAIRLFLLGLALPRADIERSLGHEAITSAARLGMLGECPVDPSLVVSLVQLFPLDAEALSPSPETAHNDESNREHASTATTDPPERRQRGGEERAGREGQTGVGGRGSGALSGEKAKACGVDGVAAASHLVFATDWPPPGSTALTEEPVMYIGPDSIGLVQHAPRRVTSRSHYFDVELGGPRVDDDLLFFSGGADVVARKGVADERVAERAAMPARQAGYGVLETVLDLCCGSGVQGIAAAALRGGNALVTCVDINPRAVRFARFNALLNGLDESRFRAVAGDLYCALASRRPSDETASSGKVQARADADKQTPAGEDYAHRSTLGETAGRGVSGGGGDAREGNRERLPGAVPFEDGEEASTRGSLYAPLGRGAPGAPRNENAPKTFDLILVNPPFVPVPPRLDSVRRRYDVFAAGGANGEEIVEGIFCGVMDHLRPGGVLAMVSELANPRAFDVKLRRWVGGCGLETIPAAEASGVAVVGREQAEGRAPENEQRGEGGGTTPSGSQVSEGDASSSSPRSAAADGDGSSAWTGVVLHEKVPWTASEYAARRAGTAREALGWERHLALVGVEEMAPGFVFVRRREPPSSGARGAGYGGRGLSGGEAMGGVDVDIQGVEKLWAPHNKAAVQNTLGALRRL